MTPLSKRSTTVESDDFPPHVHNDRPTDRLISQRFVGESRDGEWNVRGRGSCVCYPGIVLSFNVSDEEGPNPQGPSPSPRPPVLPLDPPTGIEGEGSVGPGRTEPPNDNVGPKQTDRGPTGDRRVRRFRCWTVGYEVWTGRSTPRGPPPPSRVYTRYWWRTPLPPTGTCLESIYPVVLRWYDLNDRTLYGSVRVVGRWVRLLDSNCRECEWSTKFGGNGRVRGSRTGIDTPSGSFLLIPSEEKFGRRGSVGDPYVRLFDPAPLGYPGPFVLGRDQTWSILPMERCLRSFGDSSPDTVKK